MASSILNEAHYWLWVGRKSMNVLMAMKAQIIWGWVQGYLSDVAFYADFQVGYVMLMNCGVANLINQSAPSFFFGPLCLMP